MGNRYDYDFKFATKPCGQNGPTQEEKPKGKCVGIKDCCWFDACSLLYMKVPPIAPTAPKVGKIAR